MVVLWEITLPRTIVTGENALEYLEGLGGHKALVITDQVMRSLGILDRVLERLRKAGLEVEVFDQVEPEPSKRIVMKAVEVARSFEPDWIIGLGGGSCMDVAKAVFVLYERPDVALEDISPLVELGLRKKARLLNIPTTSGTGADVTWAIVITDEEVKRKMELASREVVADITVLDPSLPASMPPRLTADTGIDALTHAIEAYTSQWRNDFSDALALWAIRTIFKYLPRAYENGQDMEAREKLHNAATMAGIAFGNAQIG
ncbi:alcohol dehydrogenase, partial [Candidatus Bathyarchaeota archaeon ex4484_135]